MGRKVLLSAYVDSEQLEHLKALSQRSKVAVSVYIRHAVDILLAEDGAGRLKTFGIPHADGSVAAETTPSSPDLGNDGLS